jgi:SAM-dependent methyltransferase
MADFSSSRAVRPSSVATRKHWEEVYRSRDDELSWFQSTPSLSLELVERYARPESRILDAGGGSSRLAEQLWHHGFRFLTVVDVSQEALRRARSRLPRSARSIRWRQADLTTECRLGRLNLWHDRAVFHFLTHELARNAYLKNLERSLEAGGIAIVATFARDGPSTCSGLPVQRYSSGILARTFGPRFKLQLARRERHRTPWGTIQPFVYSVLQKTG